VWGTARRAEYCELGDAQCVCERGYIIDAVDDAPTAVALGLSVARPVVGDDSRPDIGVDALVVVPPEP
jgi:hypothetical protein